MNNLRKWWTVWTCDMMTFVCSGIGVATLKYYRPEWDHAHAWRAMVNDAKRSAGK